LEFVWQPGIANLISVKIHDREAHTMFYLARPKIMQERSPSFVFSEIFADAFREKNVPGVPAIHYSLRDVDAGTRDIGATGNIDHTADGSAVNSHSKLQMRMVLKRLANLNRALRWRFRTGVKNQRHAIASR
jgi:hypothetical protein